MDEFSNEPEIKERVMLETQSGTRTVVHLGTIANLTPSEVWVAVGSVAAADLTVGCDVRVVLNRPLAAGLTAETSVVRLFGPSGRMLALRRPQTWVSRSRRTNGRVGLAIPAYLRPDGWVVPARTTNISVGGFHCVTDHPVEVGFQMAVSLMLTPTSTFECRAQVIRLTDDPDDPSHRQLVVAFRFLDLSVDDQALIADALAALDDDTDPTAVPDAWQTGRGHGSLAG
jgi:hypothetical protein